MIKNHMEKGGNIVVAMQYDSVIILLFSVYIYKAIESTCKVVYTVNKLAYSKHHLTTSCGIIMKQNLQLLVSKSP